MKYKFCYFMSWLHWHLGKFVASERWADRAAGCLKRKVYR